MHSSRALLLNSLIGVVLVGVVAVLAFAALPAAFVLLFASFLAVLAIIFGEKFEAVPRINRFLGARNLDDTGWSHVAETLVARETIFPVFAIIGFIVFGFVGPSALMTAANDKAQIIFLILTFAVIASGIKQSGYFRYAAFRVLEVCDGNMTRLVLYLFLLSSVLTYVTSNDIVILVMTPIILELCRQSHIRNARLLLLGQFVAANTLSMGLLIGSPTNIIVGLEVGIDFIDYFLLMAVPTLLAITVSFLVMHLINVVVYRWIASTTRLDWEHDEHYIMPALAEQPDFTSEMAYWVSFFAVVVVAVAVISQLRLSFFWITVPTMVLALGSIYLTRGMSRSDSPPIAWSERRNAVVECVTSLPYSIVAFALVFFAIADSLALRLPFDSLYAWMTDLPAAGASIAAMFGVAALVNTVNDLPAAAIVGESLYWLGNDQSLTRTIVLQSTLVSLNIACYITPVGALAGIIWFHIMGRETAETPIRTPSRLGMVVYGISHFVLTSLILAITIPTVNILFHWLLGRQQQGLQHMSGVELTATVIAGFSILVATGMVVTNVLKKNRVFVGDMRAFLTAASWLQVRSQTAGVWSQLLIVASVIVVFGIAIWRLEQNTVPSFPDFVVWIIVSLGSGEFGDWFPRSPLGQVAAGLVPLVAIVLIIFLYRVTQRTQPLEETSRRIARGEIITRRAVIVDYRAWMRDFVESVWSNRSNTIFQTVLFTEQLPPVNWVEERDYSAIFARRIHLEEIENLRVIVDEYRLERADEVYLLSDRFCGVEGEQRIALVIDEIAANLKAFPSIEIGIDRFNDITRGTDPEQSCGRLPRIFIWDDVDTGYIADQEMHRLLIPLPASWRDQADRTSRLAPIIDSVSEKSWLVRRNLILGSEPHIETVRRVESN